MTRRRVEAILGHKGKLLTSQAEVGSCFLPICFAFHSALVGIRSRGTGREAVLAPRSRVGFSCGRAGAGRER